MVWKQSIFQWLIVVTIMGLTPVMAQADHTLPDPALDSIQQEERQWVDSVYACMSTDERIGQLFMIRAHSNKGAAYEAEVARQISAYAVGGLCFFQGTPRRQVELTNYYQSISPWPMMISMDAEWGLGMRLKGAEVMNFPRQLTLGALRDNALIYQMGREVARQLRRIGTHVNFAPVVDINNNPLNPVINTRSFGEDRDQVTAKSIAYMKGLQDGHVMACAKHFPGHGDTDTDSHLDLPVLSHSRGRLDSMEMVPFIEMSRHGLQSIMVGHLHIPALDSTPNMPSTLSTKTVTDLLRKEIGFEGLIYTDAMEMKGVTKFYAPGDAELQALLAGNDIILLPNDLPLAYEKIYCALEDSLYSREALEVKVKRILTAKYRLGLESFTPIPLEGLEADLKIPAAIKLHGQLIEHSITLVKNEHDLLPIKEPEQLSISCLNIGDSVLNPFQQTMSQYGDIAFFQAPKYFTSLSKELWIARLRLSDVVVVGLFGLSTLEKNQYGITLSTRNFLAELAKHTKVVLVHFGNPYALRYFEDYDWVMQAYQEDEVTQQRAAEGLMGHYVLQGKMPVTASKDALAGSGHLGDNLFRLGYGSPELVGMSSDTLAKIDRIIDELLAEKAAPGGQIIVVKNRMVVYQKAFGKLTYAKASPAVTSATIFDLASVTKAAATTLALMKLYEAGEIDLTKQLGVYLPGARYSNKLGLTLRDILAHRSGLKPWIPFYEATMKAGKPASKYYRTKQTPGFQIQVADKLWLRDNQPNRMLDGIYHSKLETPGKYVYSDLGFILLKEMIESVASQPIEIYLQNNYYKSLGLRTLGFNPLGKFLKDRIAPTEVDDYFRMQEVQGHVHDMAAAMFGGVSGHAGLFSDAHDLAILFQMLLNGGFYGGKRYLQPETIQLFTTRYPDCSRRAFGFDMKDTEGKNTHISNLASDRAFGHLGFTGTCVWADPQYDLIFIFLSNRTYPSMKQNKLQDGQYRQRIQTIVYQSILPSPAL